MRLERPLYNYLYRWFWHPETCRDLLHDAFERLWRKHREIDEEGIDALAWKTVINLGRNHHRRSRLLSWVPMPPSMIGGSLPEAELALEERDRQLKQALERLPRASREVILLDVFCGVPKTDLASMLGIPAGTLASRKHTAVRRLKEMLDDDH